MLTPGYIVFHRKILQQSSCDSECRKDSSAGKTVHRTYSARLGRWAAYWRILQICCRMVANGTACNSLEPECCTFAAGGHLEEFLESGSKPVETESSPILDESPSLSRGPGDDVGGRVGGAVGGGVYGLYRCALSMCK